MSHCFDILLVSIIGDILGSNCANHKMIPPVIIKVEHLDFSPLLPAYA